MSGDLVPFGKYKGQPVEVMLTDQKYVEWLLTQEWFNDRYASIKTIIINQGSEPAETPEHNMLQARFLDDDFLQDFIDAVYIKNQSTLTTYDSWEESSAKLYRAEPISEIKKALRFEVHGWDVLIYRKAQRNFCESKTTLDRRESRHAHLDVDRRNLDLRKEEDLAFANSFYEKYIEQTKALNKVLNRPIESFEDFLVISGMVSTWEMLIRIELKPLVSDDYPAILRQIASRKEDSRAVDVLLTEAIQCKYVTEQQVRKIFEHENITVLTFQEIELIKKISEL